MRSRLALNRNLHIRTVCVCACVCMFGTLFIGFLVKAFDALKICIRSKTTDTKKKKNRTFTLLQTKKFTLTFSYAKKINFSFIVKIFFFFFLVKKYLEEYVLFKNILYSPLSHFLGSSYISWHERKIHSLRSQTLSL